MPRGVNEEHFIVTLGWTFSAKDKQTRRNTGGVEDVQWQRDYGIDEAGFKQGLADQVLIVSLPALVLGVAFAVEFPSLFFEFRLAAEQYTLGANDPGSTAVRK
jgi:hypothetical protein